MLQVGFITPYRIALLILIDKFCKFSLDDSLLPKLAIYITKSILVKYNGLNFDQETSVFIINL